MQELDRAPFGIIGLETALGLVITRLIEPGHLDWPAALARLTCNPAQILGIPKGTLQIGADADVTVYADLDDREALFAHPRWVLKDGEVVVRDGELVRGRAGRTFYVRPPYDPGIERELRAHFEETYTISFDNYPVAPDYLPRSEVIPVA